MPFVIVAPGEVNIGNIYAGARDTVVSIPEGRYTLTFELLVNADASAGRVARRESRSPG